MSSVKETDTHKLWRNIEPHLKKAMQTVYLREVSRSVFIMSLMNHTTFKSNHSFQQFGFCLLWFFSHRCASSSFFYSVFIGSRCSKWRRRRPEPWEVPTHTERCCTQLRSTIAEQMLNCKTADRVQWHCGFMLKVWFILCSILVRLHWTSGMNDSTVWKYMTI